MQLKVKDVWILKSKWPWPLQHKIDIDFLKAFSFKVSKRYLLFCA